MALQAPFPILVGVNTDLQNFDKSYYDMISYNDDAIIVFLDEFGDDGEVLIRKNDTRPISMEIHIPSFYGKKDELCMIYEDFRAEYKDWEKRSALVWTQDEGKGMSIAIEIQKMLKKFFVEILPIEPIYKNKKGKVSENFS